MLYQQGYIRRRGESKGIKSGDDALALYTELTKQERKQTRASWKLGAKIAGRDLMPT